MTNISPKTIENSKSTASNKGTSLNPNAAEFVPSALRPTYGNINDATSSGIENMKPSGKAILDRSETNTSSISDDEAQQFWCHQLPDDIIPDFKSSAEDELSLAGLSIGDSTESSRFNASMANEIFGTQQVESPLGPSNLNTRGNAEYLWNKKSLNGDQRLTREMEVQLYNGDSRSGFANARLGNQTVIEDSGIDPVEILASQFPGFSAESLADAYFANGCDLSLTIEMLGQFEVQRNAAFTQTQNSRLLSLPGLSKLEIPPFSISGLHNRLSKQTRDLLPSPDVYGPTSNLLHNISEFSPTARKKSPFTSFTKSSSQHTNSFNGHGKLFYGDKAPSPGASRSSPIWLGTGEAEASMYLDSREEAREFARFRDACSEQARRAFLMGDNELAMELSEKGHMYELQMKASQLKAGDTIYLKREPTSYDRQGYSRGNQDRLIDLHGLHVTDALHVLKHELTLLKGAAGSRGQCIHATISLGGGPHSRGISMSPRLPMVVEQFLMEEGLPFTQIQPGVLHVVVI